MAVPHIRILCQGTNGLGAPQVLENIATVIGGKHDWTLLWIFLTER